MPVWIASISLPLFSECLLFSSPFSFSFWTFSVRFTLLLWMFISLSIAVSFLIGLRCCLLTWIASWVTWVSHVFNVPKDEYQRLHFVKLAFILVLSDLVEVVCNISTVSRFYKLQCANQNWHTDPDMSTNVLMMFMLPIKLTELLKFLPEKKWSAMWEKSCK